MPAEQTTPSPLSPKGVALRKKKPSHDNTLTLRKLSSGGWVFVHPRAVRDRAEDLEEVQAMVGAGELEIAVDELRWLLSGCTDFMAAHVLLGEIAVEAHNDTPLARGHFGFAYQLGVKTLRRARCSGPLPGSQPANQPFYEAGRGLAYCLEKQDKPVMANEVLDQTRGLDPSDPAGIAAMLDDLRSGGAPVVSLGLPGG